jgi:hypothetical protein
MTFKKSMLAAVYPFGVSLSVAAEAAVKEA